MAVVVLFAAAVIIAAISALTLFSLLLLHRRRRRVCGGVCVCVCGCVACARRRILLRHGQAGLANPNHVVSPPHTNPITFEFDHTPPYTGWTYVPLDADSFLWSTPAMPFTDDPADGERVLEFLDTH